MLFSLRQGKNLTAASVLFLSAINLKISRLGGVQFADTVSLDDPSNHPGMKIAVLVEYASLSAKLARDINEINPF